MEVLNPNYLINHYKGLASQIRKRKLESDTPTAKGYLYACRALLSAQWVDDQLRPPPVPFKDLLETAEPNLRAILQETVEWKATADEVASKGRIPELDVFIDSHLGLSRSDHACPDIDFVQQTIDAEFRRLIGL